MGHFVEEAYLKYSKGDPITDEELAELYRLFSRTQDLVRQCPTFFGRALGHSLSLEIVSLNSMFQARKKSA